MKMVVIFVMLFNIVRNVCISYELQSVLRMISFHKVMSCGPFSVHLFVNLLSNIT